MHQGCRLQVVYQPHYVLLTTTVLTLLLFLQFLCERNETTAYTHLTTPLDLNEYSRKDELGALADLKFHGFASEGQMAAEVQRQTVSLECE